MFSASFKTMHNFTTLFYVSGILTRPFVTSLSRICPFEISMGELHQSYNALPIRWCLVGNVPCTSLCAGGSFYSCNVMYRRLELTSRQSDLLSRPFTNAS